MDEELFEWIVLVGKKEYCLTEKQYHYLMNNQDKRLVAFDNFTINPAYISSVNKQKVNQLKKIYPCKTCLNGFIYQEQKKEHGVLKSKCGICKGTGVDTSQKPEILLEETID